MDDKLSKITKFIELLLSNNLISEDYIPETEILATLIFEGEEEARNLPNGNASIDILYKNNFIENGQLCLDEAYPDVKFCLALLCMRGYINRCQEKE